MPERLQKWLAGQGLGSRRQMETWIADGRITVNGEPAVLGQKVTGRERIQVDGRLLRVAPGRRPRPKTLIYHKPAGEICTRADPQGRPTVFAHLPHLGRGRWISVGRLDFNTSGLLLFTSDGDLANRLMRPASGLSREYAVRVQGEVGPAMRDKLCHGIDLEDGPAFVQAIEFAGGTGQNRWYRVTVTEGRNRLVRRLFEAVGLRVSRLIRTRFGPINLPRELPAGKHRSLRPDELAALYAAVNLDPGVER
jgi:23S rRNA pseudouridine2605 synthase